MRDHHLLDLLLAFEALHRRDAFATRRAAILFVEAAPDPFPVEPGLAIISIFVHEEVVRLHGVEAPQARSTR